MKTCFKVGEWLQNMSYYGQAGVALFSAHLLGNCQRKIIKKRFMLTNYFLFSHYRIKLLTNRHTTKWNHSCWCRYPQNNNNSYLANLPRELQLSYPGYPRAFLTAPRKRNNSLRSLWKFNALPKFSYIPSELKLESQSLRLEMSQFEAV